LTNLTGSRVVYAPALKNAPAGTLANIYQFKNAAVIKNPLSQSTWVLWTAGSTPAGNENYKIIVRATDKTGQIQTSEFSKPFPDGASGYRTVNV
jgi:hypothetical protein